MDSQHRKLQIASVDSSYVCLSLGEKLEDDTYRRVGIYQTCQQSSGLQALD
jgi:hypothetical protein